jgi:hypothetical protein
MTSPALPFADETLMCCDCEKTFVYTAAQQEIHYTKGYKHKPKRCEACRRQKNQRPATPGQRRQKRPIDAGLSDRDLILEVGKSVQELRVLISNEFRKLHEMIDEIYPAEGDDDAEPTTTETGTPAAHGGERD